MNERILEDSSLPRIIRGSIPLDPDQRILRNSKGTFLCVRSGNNITGLKVTAELVGNWKLDHKTNVVEHVADTAISPRSPLLVKLSAIRCFFGI